MPAKPSAALAIQVREQWQVFGAESVARRRHQRGERMTLQEGLKPFDA